jgi:uncharacterized protein YbjT (DUF2867 family)
MAKYVVAGVTGRVGSIVAAELLDRAECVTVIVRDGSRGREWGRRGAVVATGSLEDRRFLARTLREAAGFFTLLPENVAPDDFHGARRRMADAMAGGVQDGGVRHVVMLSAIAAHLPDGNGPAKDLHYCERQLAAHANLLTVLRACYFQDNVAGVIPAAIHAGVYPNFLAAADQPVPMIATGDIGRFAAHALANPPQRSETVDLFGPSYTVRQVADTLGRVLGTDLEVVDIPPAQQSDTLVEAGVPRPLAEAVAEMFAAFNSGLIRPQGDRQLVGAASIEETIKRYVPARTTAVMPAS